MEIIVLIVLLLLSGFFSGSETALVAFSRLRLRAAVESGVHGAKLVQRVLDQPDRFLTTILVSNTFVNIAAAAICTGIAVRYMGTRGIVVAAVSLTIVILIFGEILPKTFAARNSERMTYAVIRPIRWTMIILAPVVKVFSGLTGFLIRRWGGDGGRLVTVTEDELKMLIHIGEETGVLDEGEKKMLHSVIEFTDTMVKEVMTPRLDVVALDVDSSYAEIMRVVVEEGYSRLPVYRENLDDIVGVVYVKDLLRLWEHKDLIILRDIVRKPYFIPETKKIGELLREFQTRKIHMAIVVDEFGATEGLVTLEDLLEEIVGEIEDEFDQEEAEFALLPDGTYRVSGKMSIEDFNEALGVSLPEEEEFETLAGFVINRLGRIPERGEKITYDGLTFTATEVSSRRLITVHVSKKAIASEAEDEGTPADEQPSTQD